MKLLFMSQRVIVSGLIVFMMLASVFVTEPAFAASGKIKVTNMKSGYVIEPGHTVRLKYKVNGKYRNRSVRFKSSDTRVVSVTRKGLLKARQKGTAKITVYVKHHKSIRKTIRIKVGARVDKMSLGGTVHLRPGHKLTLSPKVLPADAASRKMIWKSSNPKVVKVSSKGTLTARKKGTARITARATDGSRVKTSVRVIVYKAPKKGKHKWIAHRGEHYDTGPIENTAAAFTKAGKSGFWGAECDIWETLPQIVTDEEGNETLTTDIVINHDDSFQRVWGVDRLVKSMTAEEIRTASYMKGVCFLDKFLSICVKYGMVPVIEIKDPEMSQAGIQRTVDLVYETGVRSSGSKEGGLRFLKTANMISLYPELVLECKTYAEQRYGVSPVATIVIGEKAYRGDLSELKEAKEQGFTTVAMKKSLINEKYSRYCHENGMLLRAWAFGRSVASDEAVYQQIIKGKYSIDMFSTNGKIFR